MGEAEEEEDFSLLPYAERFSHKNWKVRRQGYEDAARAFEATPSESAAIFRELADPALWKGVVMDSNVAAQQDGVNALCAFLRYGGTQACVRSRSATITPLVEKGLSSAKATTKQSSLEALLLYVEIDKAEPIMDDLVKGLGNKLPKIVASTLSAMSSLYNAYGVKIVEPKPALKALPKAFSHADKSVRAEAQNLAKELYRWLREAMKPLFWDELKDVQKADLEKLFEEIKTQPAPKQARLQRSQQAAMEQAQLENTTNDTKEGSDFAQADEADAVVNAFDLAEPVDVLGKLPTDFSQNMASSKWKERKDALDALFNLANTPRIKEGPFDDVVSSLAKCMKDANVAVVSVAANCVDVLAKGLQKSFAKHRSRLMPALLERMKERKQSVVEALSQALDSLVVASSLSDSLDDMVEFSRHKNPQVKSESVKLLIRGLAATPFAPTDAERKVIADTALRCMSDSVENLRTNGAQVMGTLMKITGERALNPQMEGLDNVRKEKVKEFFQSAKVKAKARPARTAPSSAAATGSGISKPMNGPTGLKRPVGSGTAGGSKPSIKRATTPPSSDQQNHRSTTSQAPSSAMKSAASSRPAPTTSKLGNLSKPNLAPASSGLKKKLPGAGPPPAISAAAASSPMRRNMAFQADEDGQQVSTSSTGMRQISRGLTGRPLGKPTASNIAGPASPTSSAPTSTSAANGPSLSSYSPPSSSVHVAEIESLRSANASLTLATDDLRMQSNRLTSQINELQNQNAQLIEDHTRDVLSIKAKETQLHRARSDAEAAEQACQRLQRENEKLTRELNRVLRQPPIDNSSPTRSASPHKDVFSINNRNPSRQIHHERDRSQPHNQTPSHSTHERPRLDSSNSQHSDVTGSSKSRFNDLISPSEEKENSDANGVSTNGAISKQGTQLETGPSLSGKPEGYSKSGSSVRIPSGTSDDDLRPTENWRRANEVTIKLKNRIQQMKARQGLDT